MCSQNILCMVRHQRKKQGNNESMELNINTMIKYTFIQDSVLITNCNINTNLLKYMVILLSESGVVVGIVVSGSCMSIVEAVEASKKYILKYSVL